MGLGHVEGGRRRVVDAGNGGQGPGHRAEYLQQIPEATRAHQLVYPYRSDAESLHEPPSRADRNEHQPALQRKMQVKPFVTPHPRTPHLCSAPIRYAVHVSGQVAPDVRPGNRGEHQRTPTDQRACTSRLKIHSLGFLQAPAFVPWTG